MENLKNFRFVYLSAKLMQRFLQVIFSNDSRGIKRIHKPNLGIIVLLAISFYSSCNTGKMFHHNVSDNPAETENTNPSDWKTYANKNLGISFMYPGSWFQEGNEVGQVNRNGTVAAIEINFRDPKTGTTLFVSKHIDSGAEFFKYAAAQKDAKEIEIAGNKGIEVFSILSVDGRGNEIRPALKSMMIYFLDNTQRGEIEMQFKISIVDEKSEVAKFRHLLSTCKFIN